jgi:hypothetical protein
MQKQQEDTSMIKYSPVRFVLASLRSLIRSTDGNGEVVATLVAVGIAVTLGLAAVTMLGTSSQTNAGKLGGKITAIGGN